MGAPPPPPGITCRTFRKIKQKTSLYSFSSTDLSSVCENNLGFLNYGQCLAFLYSFVEGAKEFGQIISYFESITYERAGHKSFYFITN